MDHILRTDSEEQRVKRRPKLITKYTNIKNALNHFDNLPTDLKSFTVVYASMFG